MTSIYQRALGASFERLHPQLQRRLGLTSTDLLAVIATGVMAEVWHGPTYLRPLLTLGALDHLCFPEQGRQVPFRIESYAYIDPRGREMLAWITTFQLRRARRADDYLVYDDQRGGLVSYPGTLQHLATELVLLVDASGGLHRTATAQRLAPCPRLPALPAALALLTSTHEWYDDEAGCFRLEVAIRHPTLGPLFGYSGSFHIDWRPLESGTLPAHARPRARLRQPGQPAA